MSFLLNIYTDTTGLFLVCVCVSLSVCICMCDIMYCSLFLNASVAWYFCLSILSLSFAENPGEGAKKQHRDVSPKERASRATEVVAIYVVQSRRMYLSRAISILFLRLVP